MNFESQDIVRGFRQRNAEVSELTNRILNHFRDTRLTEDYACLDDRLDWFVPGGDPTTNITVEVYKEEDEEGTETSYKITIENSEMIPFQEEYSSLLSIAELIFDLYGPKPIYKLTNGTCLGTNSSKMDWVQKIRLEDDMVLDQKDKWGICDPEVAIDVPPGPNCGSCKGVDVDRDLCRVFNQDLKRIAWRFHEKTENGLPRGKLVDRILNKCDDCLQLCDIISEREGSE